MAWNTVNKLCGHSTTRWKYIFAFFLSLSGSPCILCVCNTHSPVGPKGMAPHRVVLLTFLITKEFTTQAVKIKKDCVLLLQRHPPRATCLARFFFFKDVWGGPKGRRKLQKKFSWWAQEFVTWHNHPYSHTKRESILLMSFPRVPITLKRLPRTR